MLRLLKDVHLILSQPTEKNISSIAGEREDICCAKGSLQTENPRPSLEELVNLSWSIWLNDRVSRRGVPSLELLSPEVK